MSTSAPAKTIITEAQKQQFHEKGFFTLERCLPEEHLQLLRDNCQEFIDDTDAEMKKQGVDRLGLSALGKRYFVANGDFDSNSPGSAPSVLACWYRLP